MPGAARVGDPSQVPLDAHGCPACPHPAVGPAIQGSPDVLIDNLAAVRRTDIGVHAACCGPNMWSATQGSSTVFINNLQAHRMGDQDQHCGGVGQMIQGSPDVIIGG